MNKVFVEYRNKEKINILSTSADELLEAVITVSLTSVNANGDEDTIYKEYHLHVGEIMSVDELKKKFAVSDIDIVKFKSEGNNYFMDDS